MKGSIKAPNNSCSIYTLNFKILLQTYSNEASINNPSDGGVSGEQFSPDVNPHNGEKTVFSSTVTECLYAE